MIEPLSKLDIVKQSRVTDIIWRQTLNSTQDDVKLKMLIDAYIECVPNHYICVGNTFKDFIDDVQKVYLGKVKTLDNE